MQTEGTVKWFDPDRGFGFIATHDGGDLFVHRREISDGRDHLLEGQEVAFTVGSSPKGPIAQDVVVTDESRAKQRPRKTEGSYESQRPPRRDDRSWKDNRSFGDSNRDRSRPRGQGRPPRQGGGGRSARPSGPLPQGNVPATVIRVDPQKRFMFVHPEGEDFDVFVHASVLRNREFPPVGSVGDVRIEEGEKGPKAVSWESERS